MYVYLVSDHERKISISVLFFLSIVFRFLFELCSLCASFGLKNLRSKHVWSEERHFSIFLWMKIYLCGRRTLKIKEKKEIERDSWVKNKVQGQWKPIFPPHLYIHAVVCGSINTTHKGKRRELFSKQIINTELEISRKERRRRWRW